MILSGGAAFWEEWDSLLCKADYKAWSSEKKKKMKNM